MEHHQQHVPFGIAAGMMVDHPAVAAAAAAEEAAAFAAAGGARDPPAATMQDPYPQTMLPHSPYLQQQAHQEHHDANNDDDDDAAEEEGDEDDEEEEEEEDQEEDDEPGSFIKMEDSHSNEDPAEPAPGPTQQQQMMIMMGVEQQQQQQQQQHGGGMTTGGGIKQEQQQQKDEERGPGEGDAELPMLGGIIDKRAYCLLDGIFEKDGNRKRVTIPLTRLPAVLGRSHSTGDINFFSLGPAKALSRQHCVIDYRDDVGGKLITPKSALRDTDDEGKLEYEKGKQFSVVNQQNGGGDDNKPAEDDNNKENNNSKTVFPPRGAFVMEALGKNLIMVGNQRLRQGEVAILKSGTPIRMSAYSLYFLLPTDTADPPKTMDIPLQTTTTDGDNNNNPNTSTTTTTTSNNNNNKGGGGSKAGAGGASIQPTPAISGGFKRKMPGASTSSPADMPKPKVKKPKAAPFAQLQAELDALPIETLLERMNEAVESERWERKHQLIGSTISLHAVKDATSAPEIREQAADGGVARTEIMRWIKESPKYAGWVEQMMSKMEAKSYQNTITKALLKAGNVRTGSGGRYIKWILPGVKLKTPGEGGGGGAGDGGAGEKPSVTTTDPQKDGTSKTTENDEDEEDKPNNEEEEEDDNDNEEEGGDENENEEEAGGAGGGGAFLHQEHHGLQNVHDNNNNEEGEGDDEEEEEEDDGEKEAFDPGPPSSFAMFATQQQLQEESDEDESMMREAASFGGGEAESGHDFGGHDSPSQPDLDEDESMGDGVDGGMMQ